MLTALLLSGALSCGTERADVKQGLDAQAVKVEDVADGILTPIPSLTGLKVETPVKGSEPRGVRPEEFHEATIVGEIIVAKVEADHDAHIAICALGHWNIKDGCEAGFSMVTESVDPDCAPKSTWRDDLVTVRLAIRKAIGGEVTTARVKHLLFKTVRVKGVVFFDKENKGHDPSGSADNGVELHPIRSFTILEDK